MLKFEVFLKQGTPLAVNVERILYVKAEQIGSGTQVYLSDGSQLTIDEKYDDVLHKLQN